MKKPFDLGALDAKWRRLPRKNKVQIEIEKFHYRTYVHKCQQVTECLERRDWTLVIIYSKYLILNLIILIEIPTAQSGTSSDNITHAIQKFVSPHHKSSMDLTCPSFFGHFEIRLPNASESFLGFFRHFEAEMY